MHTRPLSLCLVELQIFKEPRIDLDIVTRFVPALLALGLCNSILAIVKKTEDFIKSGNEDSKESSLSESDDQSDYDDSSPTKVIVMCVVQAPINFVP